MKHLRSLCLASIFTALTAGAAIAAVPTVEPLQEAAAQIIPHGYTIVYTSGVDRDAATILPHHSRWWHARLNAALAGTGMTWRVSGHVVTISNFAVLDNSAPSRAAVPAALVAPSSGFVMVPYTGDAPVAPVAAAQAAVESQNVGLQIAPYTAPSVSNSQPGVGAASAASMPYTAAPLPAPAYTPPAPIWVLTADTVEADDLKDWGKEAGWKVVWVPSESPMVPQTTDFSGQFPEAVATVIKSLHDQGVDIKVRFYSYGNAHSAVITNAGALDNAKIDPTVPSDLNN
jgi:hypothetical protein